MLISRPAEGRRLRWPSWHGEIPRWFVRPKTVIRAPCTSRGGRESNSRPSSRKSNAITTRPPNCICTSLRLITVPIGFWLNDDYVRLSKSVWCLDCENRLGGSYMDGVDGLTLCCWVQAARSHRTGLRRVRRQVRPCTVGRGPRQEVHTTPPRRLRGRWRCPAALPPSPSPSVTAPPTDQVKTRTSKKG